MTRFPKTRSLPLAALLVLALLAAGCGSSTSESAADKSAAKAESEAKNQKPIPNGGTGLYQTAIAAVQAVRSDYDPNAINSILLFTDGKNDDPGSADLETTIKTLQSLNNPDRPVRIIALGMGPDINPEELNRLAQATGGRAYIAKDPGVLRQVFIDALQNR